jgi:hypothetical protein
MRALQVAMAVLSESPRRDGEPAFPSLGMILDLMDEASETRPAEPGGIINRKPLAYGGKQRRLQ